MAELLDRASTKGKGRLPLLLGLIFRGAHQHQIFAGGNDCAQLKLALKGVVTTSEKYTITRSEQTKTLR